MDYINRVKITISSKSLSESSIDKYDGVQVSDDEYRFFNADGEYKLVIDGERVIYTSAGISFNFEKGRDYTTMYHSPYGDLQMTIKTKNLAVLRGDSVKILVHYFLDIEGDEVFHTKEIVIEKIS